MKKQKKKGQDIIIDTMEIKFPNMDKIRSQLSTIYSTFMLKRKHFRRVQSFVWNDLENNISEAYKEPRDQKDFLGVTLACNDEQTQPHEVILSDMFKTAFPKSTSFASFHTSLRIAS